MKVTVITTKAAQILAEIKEAIEKRSGDDSITTWEFDGEDDLTHKARKEQGEMWFRPEIFKDKLVFHAIKMEGKPAIPTVTYAYYSGHLVRMLIAHFRDKFSEVTVE